MLVQKPIMGYQFHGATYVPDHELFIAKFRVKLKKVGETTRPSRYDLNQIPYDYTVKVTNRLKRLDLIECLKNYGQRFVTLYRAVIKIIPKKKKCKKAKWLSKAPSPPAFNLAQHCLLVFWLRSSVDLALLV